MKKLIFLLLFIFLTFSCVNIKISIEKPKGAESDIPTKRLLGRYKAKPVLDTIIKDNIYNEPIENAKKDNRCEQVNEDFIQGTFLGESLNSFHKFCNAHKLKTKFIELTQVDIDSGRVTFMWKNNLSGDMECRSYFIFKKGTCEAQSNVFMESDTCVNSYESWAIEHDLCSLSKNKVKYLYNGMPKEETSYIGKKNSGCF